MFGALPDGRPVERVLLRAANGFGARIITFGAALQALMVPDKNGRCDDVVLGHDEFKSYLDNRRFFGATVGRYANRIANARFVLDGNAVQLTANNGKHALHGGPDGFDRKLWQITEIEEGAEPCVTLAYVSVDGEEGYPGRLDVRVTYRLTGPSELSISFEARADRPTIVNLTNHSFFNLEGVASGAGILDHRLTVIADRFLAIDPEAIPLPEAPRTVTGTPFDFRNPSIIGCPDPSRRAAVAQRQGIRPQLLPRWRRRIAACGPPRSTAIRAGSRTPDRSARFAGLFGKLSRRIDPGKTGPAVPAVGCHLPRAAGLA